MAVGNWHHGCRIRRTKGFRKEYDHTSNYRKKDFPVFCSKCGVEHPLNSDKICVQCEPRFGYAGFWRRFAAYFLDCLIILITSLIIGGVFGFMSVYILGTTIGFYGIFELFANILGILITWLYFAFMESSAKQATYGKRLLKIKVTDLNGQPLSFGKASGRHFGKLLSAILLFIGFLMAGFTSKKQALHDMMAGCLVVMDLASNVSGIDEPIKPGPKAEAKPSAPKEPPQPQREAAPFEPERKTTISPPPIETVSSGKSGSGSGGKWLLGFWILGIIAFIVVILLINVVWLINSGDQSNKKSAYSPPSSSQSNSYPQSNPAPAVQTPSSTQSTLQYTKPSSEAIREARQLGSRSYPSVSPGVSTNSTPNEYLNPGELDFMNKAWARRQAEEASLAKYREEEANAPPEPSSIGAEFSKGIGRFFRSIFP